MSAWSFHFLDKFTGANNCFFQCDMLFLVQCMYACMCDFILFLSFLRVKVFHMLQNVSGISMHPVSPPCLPHYLLPINLMLAEEN